uniref:Ferrous iron transport protein FeoB n=1 Tax=uncultured Nitrospirota bacterium TaxID=170969 RepID=A0A142BTT1_9BACT|nr:ferrous iron transport protein FeoB [uncultured Nitrospirota bacterium]
MFDTPGIYSLFIQSEEGAAVRDMIFSGKVDVLLQCIDATRLKQSLALTAELLELGIPMVIALNAVDESARKGLWIDAEKLSRILGVPVVESIAVKGVGTNRLKKAIEKAKPPKQTVRFGDMLENAVSSIEPLFPEVVRYKRKMALLMLLTDSYIEGYLEKITEKNVLAQITDTVNDIVQKFRGNPARLIRYTYSQWVDNTFNEITKKQMASENKFSENAARLCRSPLSGSLILIAILITTYLLVVHVANSFADIMKILFWSPVEEWLNASIDSSFWKDFLTGKYGVLNLGVASALLTVLPILSVFFILYSILEDVGYIPNLSVLSKRVFNKIGLSGETILPMVLGFGCKTMATLTAKTIMSQKERYIAIFLIAFAIPCAPQIGLSMSVLGKFGITAFVISFSILLAVEVVTGLILNKMIREDRKSLFVQMLPPIRMPNLKNIWRKTYNRLYEFLIEAFPIFIFAALALFTLDRFGVLEKVKIFLSPLVTGFLGLPLDMVEALILVMATRSLSVVVISDLAEKGQLDIVQCIIAVTLTTMFFPCFANIGSITKQLGVKRTGIIVFAITASSLLIAGGTNWVLRLIFKL